MGDRHTAVITHKIEARVRLAQSAPRGLWFRIQTWDRNPDRAVFQLECDYPKVRGHVQLYRLDLKPFGSHLNGSKGPEELRGLFIDADVTHEHSYAHYDQMSDDLELKPDVSPLAKVVDSPPQDFVNALAYVCRILNIQNGIVIPIVPIQTTLI
jgi:hypothetical protein